MPKLSKLSKYFILVGEQQHRVDTNPFKENQLKRLSTDALYEVVQTYRPNGLRPLYIQHLIKVK